MTNNWTNKNIEDYLLNHIKKSIENDAGLAIDAYMQDLFNKKNGEGKGFFAVPRLLFPEIDGLGSYLTGKPKETVLNIKTYLTDILSQLDSRYADYAAYIALIYRHGLLHQHDPKKFKFKKVEIGWWLSVNSQNLPIDIQRKDHLCFFQNCLMLNMTVFYQDTLNSVDIALKEIISKHRIEFQKSYKEQHKFLTKTFFLKKYRKNGILNEKDFSFLGNLNL